MSNDTTGYTTFEFSRVPSFHRNINRDGYFDTAEMDGQTYNYEIVFANNCDYDITKNLDEWGRLNPNVVFIPIEDGDGDIQLLCEWDPYGHPTISIRQSELVVDFQDVNSTLKGLFLKDKSTGYVIAYSILDRPVPVSNRTIFPISGAIWTLTQE